MNKLRQTAVGGKFLRLLPHVTKCRDEVATSAPATLSFNHLVFAAPTTLFSLLALAIVPLVFTAPAHADYINVVLDAPNATLNGVGKYFSYRNVITVNNSNSYGFTLGMYANNPNLVNNRDSNYTISSVSGRGRYLGSNQWGYSMTGDDGTFNEIPRSLYNAVTLADVTNKAKGVCSSVAYCHIPVTFGANIESNKSASGYYSTTLIYTVTSKPKPYIPPTPPAPDPEPYHPSTPPIGGGTGYHDWWSACRTRYPGYDLVTEDKISYCAHHEGDMDGYAPDWNSICTKRYPGTYSRQLNARSYCIAHEGNMNDYPDDPNNNI